MLPFRLVYHPRYDLNLGPHVFPSQKYRCLRDRLLRTRFCTEADFIEPEPASDEDILLAHDPAWVGKLKNGTLSYLEILKQRGWRFNRGLLSMSGEDFTMVSPPTARVFALSTISPWPSAGYRRTRPSGAP